MMIYYPFELHTHTLHSDGNMSPECLVEKALERGQRYRRNHHIRLRRTVYKLGLERAGRD